MPTTATRHFDQLLGRLGDCLCDDFVADLRTRLAGGHVAEVANAVVFAAVAGPVALTGPEIDTTMAKTIRRAGRPRQCRPA